MGRNRPSNEDAPRVPGEEGGRPWGQIVLGLILLLLLALLIPFACQALSGGPGGEQGSGAQDSSGEEKNAKDQSSNNGSDDNSGDGSGKKAADQKETAAASTDGESGGQNGDKDAIRAEVAPFSEGSGDGEAVKIPSAKISGADGWIAIHADDNGEPGAVLGHAPIQEGQNTGVEVKLDQPADSGKLYAMVHAEDPADGDYTFPAGDPPVDQSGGMVVEPFEYTATSNSAGASNGASATGGVEDKPLPDSGGFGALALAGGILLAAGSLMRQRLRA